MHPAHVHRSVEKNDAGPSVGGFMVVLVAADFALQSNAGMVDDAGMKFDTEAYLSEGPQLGSAIALPEAVGVLRIDRKEQLVASLAKCTNVRSITIDFDLAELPSWFRSFRRLRELSITSSTLKSLPAWLTELDDLRHLSIDSAAKLAGIPPHVWKLPRLESLWLFHTTFDELAGIERAPALRELIVYSDELEPALPSIAKRLAKARGVDKVASEGQALRIERKPTARLSASASAKRNATALGTLPRKLDARGIDLSGQTFEDLDIELDLRGAQLTGTTWRRCRFQHTDMSRAQLAEARFDHCHFESNCDLRKVKAKGAVFEGCYVGAQLEGADLQGATFGDMAPDGFLQLEGCKLRGASIEAVFTTPQNGSYLNLAKADLRGARVRIRLTTEAAGRVARSKMAVRWKKASTAGAQTDKTTSIEYAALKQKTTERSSGPGATSVGVLCGSNASCWFVAADAIVAREWKGSVMDDAYEELPGTDFSRALRRTEGALAIGEGAGVVAQVGDCGCSQLWTDGKAWYLLDGNPGDDVDWKSKQGLALVGNRVAQLKAKRTKTVAAFEVRSKCMTLLLPYAANPFTPKQIERAVKSGKVQGIPYDHDALLVPVPNGTYEVTYEALSHRDDLGQFNSRVRIARVAKSNARTKAR